MARCKKCNENWFWDWDEDIYKYVDGSKVEIIIFSTNSDDSEIFIFKCKCGSINSVAYLNPEIGMILYSIKEWQNINWELDGNAWDYNCKNCKNITCLNDNKDYCQSINCLYGNVEG